MNSLYYYTFIAAARANPFGSINMGKYLYFDPGAKVVQGIYIGSLSTVTNTDCICQNNITYIVNLSGSNYVSRVASHSINMENKMITSLDLDKYIELFMQGITLIKNAPPGNTLVHCAAGINKSATLIALYLVDIGYSSEDAVRLLGAANRVRGVQLLTNKSFVYLIKHYEKYRTKFIH